MYIIFENNGTLNLAVKFLCGFFALLFAFSYDNVIAIRCKYIHSFIFFERLLHSRFLAGWETLTTITGCLLFAVGCPCWVVTFCWLLRCLTTSCKTRANTWKHWFTNDSFQSLNIKTAIKAANGQSVEAKTVFARSIKFLKEEALKVISQRTGDDHYNANDIQWVLTVPAIWTPKAKQFMREASYEARMNRCE